MKMRYFVFALLLAVLAAAAIGRSAFAQDGCTTDPATGKVICPPDDKNSATTPFCRHSHRPSGTVLWRY